MTFAIKTKVPIASTKAEIEKTLTRYGADRFAYMSETGRAIVTFDAKDRRIRFDVPIPTGDKAGIEQKQRSRWRALLLCIKAKLESVESGIETFEEAFLAHVVMPDGQTVSQKLIPQIGLAYKGGDMPSLLPAPRKP